LIVRRTEELGVATPANRLLHAIVKLIESKVADSSHPFETIT
jgi:ketopantoate reductase